MFACFSYPIPFFKNLKFDYFLVQDGDIEFDEFIRALSVTSRGNLDEKLNCKNAKYS